jgi:hypothetical protein
VCDFFVSNIYVSRVDVADKETDIHRNIPYRRRTISHFVVSSFSLLVLGWLVGIIRKLDGEVSTEARRVIERSRL